MYCFLEDLATVYLRNRTSAESHCSPTGAGTDCVQLAFPFSGISTPPAIKMTKPPKFNMK